MRTRSNTLKSAILYCIFVGKDFISVEGLASARLMAGLPPVKYTEESDAIIKMIEILRK